jgi:hypothetical protein
VPQVPVLRGENRILRSTVGIVLYPFLLVFYLLLEETYLCSFIHGGLFAND